MRYYFRLPTIPPYNQVRVDTDRDTDTPADIRTVDQILPIGASTLRADRDGNLPDVLGPDGATRLYLKDVTAGLVTGTDGTETAADPDRGLAGTSTLEPENIQDIIGAAAGKGLDYDDPADKINVKLSTDGGNSARFGTDDGLYVPTSSGGGTGGPVGPQAYRYTQNTPATVWTINHNLGFDPAGITVVDTDAYVRDGFAVQFLTAGQTIRLAFDQPIAGAAYIS